MSGSTYRIGEAAALLNLKTYVLRFWEMEFPQIAPVRTEKGQRLYTQADIEVLRRIRYLLHERGLTIEGARRILQEEAAGGPPTGSDPDLALPFEASPSATAPSTPCPVQMGLPDIGLTPSPQAETKPTASDPQSFREITRELVEIRRLLRKDDS